MVAIKSICVRQGFAMHLNTEEAKNLATHGSLDGKGPNKSLGEAIVGFRNRLGSQEYDIFTCRVERSIDAAVKHQKHEKSKHLNAILTAIKRDKIQRDLESTQSSLTFSNRLVTNLTKNCNDLQKEVDQLTTALESEISKFSPSSTGGDNSGFELQERGSKEKTGAKEGVPLPTRPIYPAPTPGATELGITLQKGELISKFEKMKNQAAEKKVQNKDVIIGEKLALFTKLQSAQVEDVRGFCDEQIQGLNGTLINAPYYVPCKSVSSTFLDVSCVAQTQVGSISGAQCASELPANYMYANGQCVGMAGEYPTDDNLPNLLQFFYQTRATTATVLASSSDIDRGKNYTKYFAPHENRQFDNGISTSSTVVRQIDIDGLKVSVYELKIHQDKVNPYFDNKMLVMHCENWVDKSELPVTVLERLVQLQSSMEMEAKTRLQDAYDEKDNTEDSLYQPFVHCRAGVGRTGTLLAAKVMMNPDNNGVPLECIIGDLRASRSPVMVQTETQLLSLMQLAEEQRRPLCEP